MPITSLAFFVVICDTCLRQLGPPMRPTTSPPWTPTVFYARATAAATARKLGWSLTRAQTTCPNCFAPRLPN